MGNELLYLVQDDTDVEYDTPIVLTDEQEEKQNEILKNIEDKFKELFD